jgi:hypothetical protein
MHIHGADLPAELHIPSAFALNKSNHPLVPSDHPARACVWGTAAAVTEQKVAME